MKLPIRDGVAVITGAASGIGRATALLLASRGCHLAVADRNAEGLGETATSAGTYGVTVSQHVLDISDAAAVEALPEKVLAPGMYWVPYFVILNEVKNPALHSTSSACPEDPR